MLYIASYLRHVLAGMPADGRLDVSFLASPSFLAAKAVSVADARELFPSDPRLHVTDSMPGWRFAQGAEARYVSVGAPGLKALVNLRRANGARSIHVVVTDEGIGTYGSVITRRDAMRRQGVHPVVAAAKASVIATAARLLTSERWPAYRRVGGTWRVVPEVAQEFVHHTEGAPPSAGRTAVILTQPFVDLDLVSEADYVAYVRGLAETCAAANLDVVVRPHPSEDVRRYAEFDVMPGRGTAELDPLVIGAHVVLGGPSTALINLAAMFDANVVWVSEPSLTYLDTDVSRAQTEIFNAFLGEPVSPDRVAERIA